MDKYLILFIFIATVGIAEDGKLQSNHQFLPFALLTFFLLGLWIYTLNREIKKRELAEKKLKEHNDNLQDLVLLKTKELLVAENDTKNREQLLQQQSRFAAMGEMIGAIAHQWRQPLTALSGVLINIEDDFDFGELTKDRLRRHIDKSERLLQFMSHTIDDFRNFFKPSNEQAEFNVIESFVRTIELLSAQLKEKSINSQIIANDTLLFNLGNNYDINHFPKINFFGYPNYFQQAVLNIIANSKDAIIQNNTKNGKIEIKITSNDKEICIEISDNGGGIKPEIIDRIFDPYFSTKGEKGTGVGLYMTKTILQNSFNGDIWVENIQNGAKFTIVLKIT